MIVDFRELDNDKELEFDLCIIGAGAAGITISREFIGSNIKVCCVESGGLYLEENTQSLYDGENLGLPYFPLSASRLRFLGGTTNHWGGWCIPLNEIDFIERPWVPHSGWPITRKTLDPFYERAQLVCELGPYIYDERLLEGLDVSPITWLPEKLISRFWQFSPPTRFGVVYKEEIEKATNITVLLNANVTKLSADNTASAVNTIRIESLERKMGRIKAKFFVLACGAVENARILLHSNNLVSQGLGNQYDLVGRFFMEHPQIFCGTAVAKDSPETLRLFSKDSSTRISSPILHSEENSVDILSAMCLSDQIREQEQLLDCGAVLRGKWDSEHGITALKELKSDYANKRMPDDLWIKIWRVMKDLDEVALRASSHMFDKDKVTMPPMFDLMVISEQTPNPESRVTLSEDKDKLGMNKIRLDWRLTELEKHTIKVLAKTVATELGRLNLARIRLDDWLLTSDSNWPPTLEGGGHHMGTTRMSDDPKKGVVSKDCRVHGMDNLYIAGSSVFPTGGFANPTLTIIALGLRLADHLKDRLS